jgi:uncharacterized protein
MRTGAIEANLVQLNEEFQLTYIPDLIACKQTGSETAALEVADLSFYQREYQRLLRQLEDAHQTSNLPETPSAKQALHDLLVHLRIESLDNQ